jgi:6-phosphofructokinase
MKIAVLTGGGDVPGLNPTIKALVYRAQEEGYEVIGFRRGWWGPLHYSLEDNALHWKCAVRLDKNAVRTVDRSGGTFLHTSRTRPSHVASTDLPEFLRAADWDANDGKMHDCTPHILQVLDHLNVKVMVPIGGDDTLSYGLRLHEEGVPVIAIPKTMDNDVFGTDYCIGFSTAVTRSVNFIHSLRTSAGSHERIGVIELFGRNSGETSLIAAYLGGVDRAIISEVPFEPEKLAHLVMEDKHNNPSNYAMITVSEGAQMLGTDVLEYGDADAYGHRKLGGIGVTTGDALKKLTGEHILYQQVAYLMRSGAPDSMDLMVGFNYANMAMDLIVEGKFGRLVAVQKGTYTNVPLQTLSQGLKRVDVAELYDVDQYRPKIRHVDGKPMFLY